MQRVQLNLFQELKCIGSTVQTGGATGHESWEEGPGGVVCLAKDGLLCGRHLSGRLKGRLCMVMVRPARLYGIEAVAVTKEQEKNWRWLK